MTKSIKTETPSWHLLSTFGVSVNPTITDTAEIHARPFVYIFLFVFRKLVHINCDHYVNTLNEHTPVRVRAHTRARFILKRLYIIIYI